MGGNAGIIVDEGGCDGKREREISQGGMDVRVPQKRLRSISGEGIGAKMVLIGIHCLCE